MRHILIIILFATGLLLSSCGKSSPQPTCEQNGEEVIQPQLIKIIHRIIEGKAGIAIVFWSMMQKINDKKDYS